MPRYICIHGHFYQPPRENPWLETVELQESAAPWHDWNARISAECYSRNAASRILNEQGYIRRICNNYSRISFNIGPTLLTWLEENDPLCYSAILEADRKGSKRFSGHGPAMAQVYNHIIMPLASRRDKETQVKWGIEDFKKRFGRMPEGMWLAECAVDTESLEVLAENGIAFTILSPYQAQSVRVIGWGGWQDVTGGRVDTRCAYTCKLPSGREIAIFFYDGVLSQRVAFEGLLDDGGVFAHELETVNQAYGKPILCNIATDGESYGHHHAHGDMALAYCLERLEQASGAQ
ncbi:MAG: glycoside hydrolase, partial [Synergistaceae bacterium]|nr:glycoside hydrolase [Synergistaceae bacterium]